MSKTGWAIISAMLLVLAGLLYHYKLQSAIPAEDASQMSSPIAEASYSCDQGHTIRAAYFDGPPAAAPAEGQPPKPTGSVEISLDGGTAISLSQTLSADGGRYSDGDPALQPGKPGAETLVFWNKGNTAFIMRNNETDKTFTNCATAQQ